MPRPDPALIALSRFGLGPRPGDPATIGDDPRGWLEAQVGGPAPADDLPGHMALHRVVFEARGDAADDLAFQRMRQRARRFSSVEAKARMTRAARTDAPFRERWVRFWSNHLTVSVRQPLILHLAGAFEREVVAPRAWGGFDALLQASTRHPAMLLYLDNAHSVGPGSRMGRRRGRGLNENLARELLELHTLGVDGGYGQADVEALAAMLTGWTAFGGRPMGHPDLTLDHGFTFRGDLHEPGDKTLLGERVPEGGEAEATAALSQLATHPRTARHLSEKVARHFVADDPPPRLVADLEDTWRETGGDLGRLARRLVTHDLAWRGPRDAKLRSPEQLMVATVRALDPSGWSRGGQGWAHRAVKAQAWLGQPTFSAPSPAGWPDTAAAWSGPEQLLRRVELAGRVGAAAGPAIRDPERWAQAVLGDRLEPALRAALRASPSRADAVSLALASPAFQWS